MSIVLALFTVTHCYKIYISQTQWIGDGIIFEPTELSRHTRVLTLAQGCPNTIRKENPMVWLHLYIYSPQDT